MFENGTRVLISAEVADRIRLGKRHHKKGLIYDSAVEGFEPAGGW